MAVDVDDDETSPSSSFSRNDIASDDDKKTAPVRLNIRGGGGGDDKGTGENIDNLINKNESKEVEQGFTPHLPFLSSDEVVGDNAACATVTYSGIGGEWDDDKRVQPDPSLGYTCEGVGNCKDANGHEYSYVYFDSIPSQAACADKCAALTTNSEFHRGFEYWYIKGCYCLYDHGEAPENVPESDFITNRNTGKGNVASSEGWPQAVCFSKFHKQYVIKSADGTNLRAYPDGKVDLASSVDTDMVWTIEEVEEGKFTIESSYATYLRAHPGGEGSKVDLASEVGYWGLWNIVVEEIHPGMNFSIKSVHGTYLRGHPVGTEDPKVDLQTYVDDWEKWTLEKL